MQNILLRNGSILDGSGAPSFRGDLLIVGERIAEIGRISETGEARVLDCSGLTIAPGFIDAHSHSDLQVLENRPEKVRQGVTTEVVGNCGFSPYPATGNRAALHEFANGIFCGRGDWGWTSAREYLEAVAPAPVHVASLVGHGSLRIAQAGPRHGALEESDIDAMERLLDDALGAGACGFSTGLMYAPGESAPGWELERLLRVVAHRGKIYATHMRDYSAHLLEAIEEQAGLARRTGCRLQISHLQAVGRRNWNLQTLALEAIEQARREGADIAFDCYPYICGSTVLTQMLPQWALDGGVERLLSRLADANRRREIAAAALQKLDHEWNELIISSGPEELAGMSIAEIAETRGTPPMDTVFDLLVEQQGAVNVLEYNQSESNLRQTLSHPLGIVISDGFYVKGRPHPRLAGTFPLLLGKMCRELGWLELPEAVRKITSAPAERFGLTGRGKLQPGFLADITVFDAARIGSPATYESPEKPPVGIVHVFAGGKALLC